MSRSIIEIGMRFDRLIVTEKVDWKRWWVLCDCGGEKIVYGSTLAAGHLVSCGCHIPEMHAFVNALRECLDLDPLYDRERSLRTTNERFYHTQADPVGPSTFDEAAAWRER